MRSWIKYAVLGAIVAIAAVAFAVCHRVDELSDSAAAASVAIRAEKQALEDLGHTVEHIAGKPDQIDAQLVPALDRYLAANALAVARCKRVGELDPDPKTDAYLGVLAKRSRAFGDMRELVVKLRGRPEEQARELAKAAGSLLQDLP